MFRGFEGLVSVHCFDFASPTEETDDKESDKEEVENETITTSIGTGDMRIITKIRYSQLTAEELAKANSPSCTLYDVNSVAISSAVLAAETAEAEASGTSSLEAVRW